MTEEIKYQGVTANPSDYDCQDGTLALSLNLWPENGSLKPVLPPEKLLTSPYEIVCVHKTSAFTHYIALSANSESDYDLYFHNGNTDTATSIGSISSKVREVTSIGNTLVVLTDGGMRYYLWKDSTYKYLGNHIPELDIIFTLFGNQVSGDEFEITKRASLADWYNKDFPESDDAYITQDTITSSVLAKVNKFIADEATNKGRFLMPFFVRYAYRLYDGSLTMHSAPILMPCATETTPFALVTEWGDSTSRAKVKIAGITYDLYYEVDSQALESLQDDWSDIVSSVDIFISAPIYRYDQSGKIKQVTTDSIESYCVCDMITSSDVAGTIARWNQAGFVGTNLGHFILPGKSDSAYISSIEDCHAFYFLKSLPVSDLSTISIKIDIPEDYLQSLVNREVMTDDYDSHDSLIPSISFNYNSRLNITGLKKTLFRGFTGGVMNPHIPISSATTYTRFYVYIEQAGKTYVLMSGYLSRCYFSPDFLFYYPSTNATKVIIDQCTSGSHTYYAYNLKGHDFLNGSYAYIDHNTYLTHKVILSSTLTVSSDVTISIPNKIYTSEVNNPFLYLVTNINTVGAGEIIGISTAAKALSQGQFGEFPLYAFSTDGIWALTVSSTGGYSAKQPVSRDVCIDADSITQTDNSVIYATERGLMMIAGSETACLSDVIDDKDGLAVSLFEEFTEAYNLFKSSFSDIYFGDLGGNFRLFLDGLKVIYDDTSRRLILFSTGNDSGAAYVYSMNEKAWGMMSTNGLVRAVPSWPEALAQNANGDLFDFSKRRSNGVGIDADDMHHYSETAQLILTRPFKLKLPDVHKTIDTIIQRGNFHKKNVQQVLYGSNDLEHWIPVYSSDDKYLRGFHGTPYKYYVLAMKCVLADGESLSGMTVQYTPKLTNQPR